jgi:hypothetical protein
MINELASRAQAILRVNNRGGYTVPTNSGLYPAQWSWDSCLVALGFAQYNIPRAWQEPETLLSGQWANGMVPSILFHGDDSTYFPNSDILSAPARAPTRKAEPPQRGDRQPFRREFADKSGMAPDYGSTWCANVPVHFLMRTGSEDVTASR